MKVTFLITQSLESPGGGGRFFPLAKCLAQRGFEVTIIAFHHDFANLKVAKFRREGVEVVYVGQMHVLKRDNRKIYFHPLKLLWLTLWGTLKMSWVTWRTPADVIQVCKAQPMNGVAAWLTHRLKKTPVFLDADDYEAMNNKFSGRWQQRIVAAFENWIPSFSSGLTVGNLYIAEHFLQLGYPAARLKVVYNAVDRERFEPFKPGRWGEAEALQLRRRHHIPDGKRIIGYIGSISLTVHAIDLLLNAFQPVAQAFGDVILLLVGGGEDLEKVTALSQKLGLAERVVFTGKIPFAAVPPYYRVCEFTVDPHDDSIASQSTFSLKLVESIASGVPCITADVGDRRLIAGEHSLAVTPNSETALQRAMEELLADKQLLDGLRQRATAAAEAHFWDARVQTFIDLYEGRKR